MLAENIGSYMGAVKQSSLAQSSTWFLKNIFFIIHPPKRIFVTYG
jgi:hypothetical protein